MMMVALMPTFEIGATSAGVSAFSECSECGRKVKRSSAHLRYIGMVAILDEFLRYMKRTASMTPSDVMFAGIGVCMLVAVVGIAIFR